jgi:hypothetical protein
LKCKVEKQLLGAIVALELIPQSGEIIRPIGRPNNFPSIDFGNGIVL